MKLSNRLRKFRVDKKLSQSDLEKLTGLRRQYISRLENGRTTPSLGTLERLAVALGVPVYRFFYEGSKPPKPGRSAQPAAGQRKESDPLMGRLLGLLSRIGKPGRDLLMATAVKMSNLQRE